MAKTQDKRKPAPKDSTAQVEEKIVEISSEVAKAAKDYRVPIIVGLIVVVGVIGLFALVNNFKERARRNLNAEFFVLMDSDAATIESGYAAFLSDIEGDPFEPYAVNKVCGWLVAQGTPEKRETALKLAQGALVRHANSPGLKNTVDGLTQAKNDSSFAAPIPPPMEDTTNPNSFTSGTGSLTNGASGNTPPPPPEDISPPVTPDDSGSTDTSGTPEKTESNKEESSGGSTPAPKTTSAPAGAGG